MNGSRFKSALIAAAFAAASAQAADPVSTVGSTTETNGLERNGRFVVRTPSILRPGIDQEVPPNVLAAIAQYDRILEIPTTAANRAEALRRGADLRVQLADIDGEVNLPVLRKAIAMYQALLREAPDYPLNDRALYQLARAQQAVGEVDAAITSLQALGERYPYSFRTPDGVFRAAELLFQRNRFDEAEPAYAQVLAQGPSTPYFEPAQYKFGWTLVRQGKYAEALTPFFAILDRELPPGTLEDPTQAIAALTPAQADVVRDVLKVTGRSLAALGGGRSLNTRFEQAGSEPRFATLLYAALASQLLEQQRYTDAADADLAFVERHPQHPRAPEFESRAMAAYQQGGFGELLFIELPSSFIDLLAGLFELFLGLGHVGGVLGFLHALLEVIEIVYELLLLFFETLELVLQILLLLFGFGLIELLLQFLHLLGQCFLTACEFLQPIQHLQVLLLLGGLFFGRLLLFFVALFVLLQHF